MIHPDTIACWRINYGLDTRNPLEAMRWWNEKNGGMAPSGAVAALGLCLIELERLQDWSEIDQSGQDARLHQANLIEANELFADICAAGADLALSEGEDGWNEAEEGLQKVKERFFLTLFGSRNEETP